MSTVITGNKGEDIACWYLKKQGYQILERNFRIRGGEIDIVARDKEYLVFVEVKTRYSHDYGSPAESMTPWKIRYLLKTAQFYLLKINWGDKPYRLDFVSVDYVYPERSRGTNDRDNPELELIRNITG